MSKQYDLVERSLRYTKNVRRCLRQLPKNFELLDDMKQLARSSGSIGANYIEANEALSRKDFIMRLKISRKEAKESRYWLELLMDSLSHSEFSALHQEAGELVLIFNAIISKVSK